MNPSRLESLSVEKMSVEWCLLQSITARNPQDLHRWMEELILINKEIKENRK